MPSLLNVGLAGTLSFCAGAEEAGIDQVPYLDGVGYLVLLALSRFSADEVRSILENFLDTTNMQRPRMQASVLALIFNRLMVNARNACTRYCVRITFDLTGPPDETAERYAHHYWDGRVAAENGLR